MVKKTPSTPAKKTLAKRKPARKKPVDAEPVAETTREIPWRLVVRYAAFGVAMLLFGAMGGIWSAGGIEIEPGRSDVLSQSHAADRVSQVRILREYAGQSFPDEPTAQKWLNEQRIAARIADWIPYTDALGAAADEGVDSVKALADKLEAVK